MCTFLFCTRLKLIAVCLVRFTCRTVHKRIQYHDTPRHVNSNIGVVFYTERNESGRMFQIPYWRADSGDTRFESRPASPIVTEVFRGFPQPLRSNSGIVLRLSHDRFLPNSFQIIIHLPSVHSTLCSPATESAPTEMNEWMNESVGR
jgi:hypothetical protein